MGIIKELDMSLANLVAAGEVVERPASVVKELCENSIDAGAKNITVEIKNGGITFIRVTDDGCGMAPEDAAMSIKRHATSKIREKKDLAAIMTLGFRGEALAATAAVAKMRIITKKKDNVGVVVTSIPGEGATVKETGAQLGTTIIVENLFENVPARRKFLKRDATEAMYVSSVCEKLSLSNPDISFTFICDGEIKFTTSGTKDLKNVIYSILGRTFTNNMIKVDYTEGPISIKGYLGSPGAARGNRNEQIFFINGRNIKNRTISAALEEGTVSYVPKDKFPCAVLNIEMHPSYVDVNVHPAKNEVRFANERAVFDAVYRAIKFAIAENAQRPSVDVGSLSNVKYRMSESFLPVDEKRPSIDEIQVSVDENTKKQEETVQKELQTPTEPVFNIRLDETDDEIEENDEPDTDLNSVTSDVSDDLDISNEKEQPEPVLLLEKEVRYIGEFFKTYLVAECGDEAYIIDKHAAHERLIFERMKRNLKDKDKLTQLLMIELECSLTSEELSALREYSEQIKSVGFGFSGEGREIKINEIPSNLSQDAAKELFLETVNNLCTGKADAETTRQAVFERSLYQSCCKAAIKAGEINGDAELAALVKELMKYPDVTHCPHGRPVAFVIKRSVLERRFGRE